VTARLAVLVSGNGSNLQAIIDATASGAIDASVVLVVSNVADAYGLSRASGAGIDSIHYPVDGRTREDYDAGLAQVVSGATPDWVVLAGWMRILTMPFLGSFSSRVVNLHPALPGMFAGVDAIARAHRAFEAGEIDHSGVMTHLVPDERVDDGPVLGTSRVELIEGEQLSELEARMHEAEHRLLVDTLADLCQDPT
jgi:phosphoribosylglycinamide formyltransferase-1